MEPGPSLKPFIGDADNPTEDSTGDTLDKILWVKSSRIGSYDYFDWAGAIYLKMVGIGGHSYNRSRWG
jgi:hypothetical protein